MVLAFDGDLEFDPALFEVRRAGVALPLEPQAFDVLAYLVSHRDRVVPKEELMDGVWGGRFVSETAVTSRIKQIRRALGDDGHAQRMIRTLHGRGYRFVAPVEVRAEMPSSAPIRYTVSDGLHIAYQVTGGGELDIVLVPGFVSHLELDWADPRHAHFLERLGSYGRLIRFDKRGTGMSDRPSGLPDLETRMHDVLAVMDAVGSRRAVLVGYSEGARYIAERIPGARLELLDGDDHFVSGNPDQILDAVEPFLRELPKASQQLALAAVAAPAGPGADELASGLLAAGGRLCSGPGGRPVVQFDGPATAVRAGLAQLRGPGRLGVAIAEVPRDETQLGAYGVQVALDLADKAPPGALWVTSAVRDLLAGSGVVTEPAGSHAVGVADPQPVFRAVVAS